MLSQRLTPTLNEHWGLALFRAQQISSPPPPLPPCKLFWSSTKYQWLHIANGLIPSLQIKTEHNVTTTDRFCGVPAVVGARQNLSVVVELCSVLSWGFMSSRNLCHHVPFTVVDFRLLKCYKFQEHNLPSPAVKGVQILVLQACTGNDRGHFLYCVYVYSLCLCTPMTVVIYYFAGTGVSACASGCVLLRACICKQFASVCVQNDAMFCQYCVHFCFVNSSY